MVKANELRIGNHALYFGKLLIVQPQDFSALIFDEVEPIPLTPEILEKCGFETYHSNPRLEYFYVNKQGYYPFLIYHTRDFIFYYNEKLELRYLHQLQNLYFALTGQELEVNL